MAVSQSVPLAAQPVLTRQLSAADAAAIIISNVIGGGIFFVPILLAQTIPNPAAVLAVWLVGGALAFAGAMAYAELAALRPRAGGEYVYLREAYGPVAAFLTGWTSFVAGFSGAIAASAVVLADYIGRFLPGAADPTPLLTIPVPGLQLVVSPRTIVALTAVAALSAVHIRGLGPGRILQNVLAVAKVGALVVLVALGFTLGQGEVAHVHASGPVTAGSWLLALIPVMFAYSGWNAAAYVAEEIRDPGRNVPKALALGTLAVVAIYLALNLLYLYAVPIGEIAQLPGGRLIDIVAERLFGFVVGDLIAVFTIVSLAASISAMVIAGPRVYYAMARDGAFLKVAAEVHPRYGTPAMSIVAQAVWSGVLILSGTLATLVAYTGFAVVLFAGVAVTALFVLRRREPGAERPFRAWGYPIAPGLFVVACLVIVANELVRNPGTSATGLLIIGAGLPLYWLTKRRRPGAL